MSGSTDFHWNFVTAVWTPKIPLDHSLDCHCNISGSSNITDPCYATGDIARYDLGQHVIAIFIIMAASLFGVGVPVLLASRIIGRTPSFVRKILYFGKFFGSGVILATGFVHIFPEAVEVLQNPCLPPYFSDTYHGASGFFAMLGALGMHLLEIVSSYFMAHLDSIRKQDPEKDPLVTDHNEVLLSSDPHSDQDIHDLDSGVEHTHGPLLAVSENSNWATALLLEIGISIHSIIIGITLGTATEDFKALLIALSFHQFFEGLGLGQVLAETEMFETSQKKFTCVFISAAFYGMTTPLGVAIGIGISSTPESTGSLIIKGILDSISAGILIYAALVSLISVVFQTRTFKTQPVWQKGICFISFYLGAGLMASLAIWS